MALESKMNRREILKISHRDVELLKRRVLDLLVKNSDPEEAFSILSFMRGMIQNLLIPVRMTFFGNDL